MIAVSISFVKHTPPLVHPDGYARGDAQRGAAVAPPPQPRVDTSTAVALSVERGDMTDDELLGAFERGVEPEGGFHHAQHVRVAWLYLRAHSLPDALVRFTTALRAFAAAQGTPGLYHETITVAFMLVLAERMGDPDAPASWDAFAGRNADLLAWKPSVLDRYYRSDTLWSDRARRGFVMPDRLA